MQPKRFLTNKPFFSFKGILVSMGILAIVLSTIYALAYEYGNTINPIPPSQEVLGESETENSQETDAIQNNDKAAEKSTYEQLVNESLVNKTDNTPSLNIDSAINIHVQYKPSGNTSELVDVIRIVDGDTIVVSTYGTLRLIGIDTPETKDPRKEVQCWGMEASAQAERILKGKQVYLEFDSTQQKLDKYGRTLAYVFRSDGLHYNLQMIQEGFAREYTYNKAYQYQKEFKAAETNARQHQIGLWSPATCNGTTNSVIPPKATPANSQNQSQTPTTAPTAPTQTNAPTTQVPTQPTTPVTQVTNVYNHLGNHYNCPDFKTWDEANLVYQESIRVTGKDIHRLDGDNNAIPCESLR